MNKVESADLILKLYDLRREAKMREARDWMFGFNPSSAEDIMQTMMGPDGAYLRMVSSYWDMAASFVNHGAIDGEMFNDVTGEHIMVFAKFEPFLEDLRKLFENPEAFKHLEKAIMDRPDGREKVTKTQEWLKKIHEQMAAQGNGQAVEAAA